MRPEGERLADGFALLLRNSQTGSKPMLPLGYQEVLFRRIATKQLYRYLPLLSVSFTEELMRTKEPLRQVKRQAGSALLARRLQSLQMKPLRIFLVLVVVCLFVAYGAVVAERRAIGEVDRKFLKDIVRQQSQDADTLSAPGLNTGTDNAIALNHPAVPRAELVVNGAIVRRGELVVHSGVAKHRRSSITISPLNSQAVAESGKRLN
jgi:hypothetical protein